MQIVLQNLAIFNKSQYRITANAVLRLLSYTENPVKYLHYYTKDASKRNPPEARHSNNDINEYEVIYPIIPRIRFQPNRLHMFTLHDHRTQTMKATYGNMHDKQENMTCLCKCN